MAFICPCGSAEVSTGLGDTITCFTCGRHGDHAHVGRPNLHGDSNVTVEVEVKPAKKKAAK